jgi:dihydroflavonol-4-reductase
MRALVLGATGFLGFHVARCLLEAGHDVRVLVRPTSDRRRLTSDLIDVRVGDLLDAEAVARAVAGVDWVFDAAGRISFWKGDRAEIRAQHVTGTAHVADACRRAGVRLIYTSSTAALGRPRPDGAIGDETTPFDWDSATFPYACAKRAAEQTLAASVAEGLDAVTVMPTTTFGPFDHNLSAARFIADLDAGRILGYPPGGLTVAHVQAVAAGHLAAARVGRTGERYVLGGEHLTYRALFTLIAHELGRHPPRLPVPTAVLRALGTGGSLVSAVLRRDLGLNQATATFGCVRLYYSSAKAVRELGYRPLPAADAIHQACVWWRESKERRAA